MEKSLGFKIKELRKKGYTYAQIKNELKCSKSTISYHLDDKGKEKAKKRILENKNSPLIKRVWEFKNKNINSKTRDFQRRNCGILNNQQEFNFTLEDVLKKIDGNHTCYLTGEKIDINNSPSFAFDHIIPSSKGGSNTLDNLGLTSCIANTMKNNLTVDELLYYCKKILENNGYSVNKNGDVPELVIGAPC